MSESCVRRSRLRARSALGRPVPLSQIAVLAAIALTLTGCTVLQRIRGDKAPIATQPVAASPATIAPPPQAAPVRPKRQVREVRENKEPERVALVDPKSLIGLAPGAVEKLLGSPSNVSKSDPSLVWTYAGQGCSFQVYFYPDIKTASFHALKYSSSAGEQADNICIRNILMVRSNGPS